jgi:hypothetical protein
MRSTQWVDAKEKLETGTAVASDYLAVLKLKNRFERRIVRWTRILLSGLCILLLGSCAGGYVDTYFSAFRHKQATANAKPGQSPQRLIEIMDSRPDKTEFYTGQNDERILIYIYTTV